MDNHFDLSLCDVPMKNQEKDIHMLSPDVFCAGSACLSVGSHKYSTGPTTQEEESSLQKCFLIPCKRQSQLLLLESHPLFQVKNSATKTAGKLEVKASSSERHLTYSELSGRCPWSSPNRKLPLESCLNHTTACLPLETAAGRGSASQVDPCADETTEALSHTGGWKTARAEKGTANTASGSPSAKWHTRSTGWDNTSSNGSTSAELGKSLAIDSSRATRQCHPWSPDCSGGQESKQSKKS